jgi:hypothetical protein
MPIRRRQAPRSQQQEEPGQESRIVEAVGVATSTASGDPELAAKVEEAMSMAVRKHLDEGGSIADSQAIRRKMLAARDEILHSN